MTLTVHPGSAHGTVRAPSSKSYTHRAFELALLARGATRVADPLMSEDPEATLRCVAQLGAKVTRGDVILVESDGVVRAPRATLDCANSGTTLRTLSAIAALADGAATLDGDASLRKRPMGPLAGALAALGVRVATTDGKAPLTVRGPLTGGVATLPGDVSSQFVSALLLAGARSRDGVQVRIQGELKSRPYVDITLEMMRDFGGDVAETADGFRVEGDQPLRGRDYRVPGDFSGAAFPLCAGALAGDVRVENLPLRSAQGDQAILAHLDAFGARVTRGARDAEVRAAPLRGVHLDLAHTPDLFPVLCAVAAHAEGETVLSGAAHLRFKESDRIALMVANLRKLGVDAKERPDGAVIRGGVVRGGSGLVTEGDHRIQMALAVCALRAQGPLAIDDHECHRVSYPSFLEDFASLGAKMEVAA